MGGGHWMFGGFMWLFWIAVIVCIVLLVKWIIQQGGKSNQKSTESSLEILKKRYAQGEIDKEEYEQKQKVLLS